MKKDAYATVVTALVVVAVLISLLVLMAMTAQRNDRILDDYLTAQEENALKAELGLRRAGDCVLERTAYGFVAREIKTGRVYKVKMEGE